MAAIVGSWYFGLPSVRDSTIFKMAASWYRVVFRITVMGNWWLTENVYRNFILWLGVLLQFLIIFSIAERYQNELLVGLVGLSNVFYFWNFYLKSGALFVWSAFTHLGAVGKGPPEQETSEQSGIRPTKKNTKNQYWLEKKRPHHRSICRNLF